MSVVKRNLIFDKLEAGEKDAKRLSDELKIHVSTIYRVTKEINEGKGIEQRKGSGKPKLFGETDGRMKPFGHY